MWLPAYHCPALVQPFLAAGNDVAFYGVREDLTPDYGLLDTAVRETDAIVAVRFFGFPCGVEQVRELAPGNLLIEDLAHAAMAHRLAGDVAVTSLPKFYPVQDGSEIWVREHSPLASVLRTQHRNLPGPALSLARRLMARFGLGHQSNELQHFRPHTAKRGISASSAQTIQRLDHDEIARRRRSNYLSLAGLLLASPYGGPLFPTLQAGVVPYVLPFLLRRESAFARIRGAGVQVYRWEETAKSTCAMSERFRRHLVQVPVHQELDEQALYTIARAFGVGGGGAA